MNRRQFLAGAGAVVAGAAVPLPAPVSRAAVDWGAAPSMSALVAYNMGDAEMCLIADRRLMQWAMEQGWRKYGDRVWGTPVYPLETIPPSSP